jgi:hypothetical protein
MPNVQLQNLQFLRAGIPKGPTRGASSRKRGGAIIFAFAVLLSLSSRSALAGTNTSQDSGGAIQRQRVSQMLQDNVQNLDEKRAEIAAGDFIEHLRQNSPIAAEKFANGQMDDDEIKSRVDVYLRDHPELSGAASSAPVGDPRYEVAELLRNEKGIANTDLERLAIADRFIGRLGELSGTAHDNLIQGKMSPEELASRVKVYAADLRSEITTISSDPGEVAAVPIVESFVQANYGRPTERANSISYRGSIERNGTTREFVIFKKRPAKIRIHIIENGAVIGVLGFDGSAAWRQSHGQPAIPVVGSEADDLAKQARFDDPLVDYKERGDRIRLDDRTSDKSFRLHLFETDGTEMISTVEASTMNQVSLRRRSRGGAWEEVKFNGYRKIGSTNIPFVEEQWVDGVLQFRTRIKDVALDVGLIDEFFAKPASTELEFLDYMSALAVIRTKERVGSGAALQKEAIP